MMAMMSMMAMMAMVMMVLVAAMVMMIEDKAKDPSAEMLEQLKQMLTKASASLYKATRRL